MMTRKPLVPTNELTSTQPYAKLGAGKLAATLWKKGGEQAGWYYRFNLFRMTHRGRVSQLFLPADIVDLIRLSRVLAATLADDGCLSPPLRSELARLAAALDQVVSVEE